MSTNAKKKHTTVAQTLTVPTMSVHMTAPVFKGIPGMVSNAQVIMKRDDIMFINYPIPRFE